MQIDIAGGYYVPNGKTDVYELEMPAEKPDTINDDGAWPQAKYWYLSSIRRYTRTLTYDDYLFELSAHEVIEPLGYDVTA